jgi:flagellin-specific chaperone FliS
MPNPWEKYAQQPTQDGPWSKYTAPPAEDAPTATISARPQPTTFMGKAERALSDFAGDVKYGTDTTWPGRALHAAGMQPTDNGQGEKVGDFMASPLLGTARADKGVAQVGQNKKWEGTKNIVGGLADATQIPAGFAVGPEGTLVKAGEAAASKVGAAVKPTATMGERIVSTLSKTANAEGLMIDASSPVKAFSSLTDQFIGRAKQAYQAIDKAVSGELQPVLDKITDLKKAIKTQKNLDPEKADSLLEQLTEMVQRKTDVLNKAKASGMDNAEQVLAQADKDYSRGKALETLTKKVKGASGAAREGGKTNASKFATVVDNVNNQEKATRALGNEGLAELQSHAKNALQTKKNLSAAGNVLTKVGVAAALGGGAAYGYKKLSGEN